MVPPCTTVLPRSDHSDRSSLQDLKAHPTRWGSRQGARVKGKRKGQGGSSGQPGPRKGLAVGSGIPPAQLDGKPGSSGEPHTPNSESDEKLGCRGEPCTPKPESDEKAGCSGEGRLCSRVPAAMRVRCHLAAPLALGFLSTVSTSARHTECPGAEFGCGPFIIKHGTELACLQALAQPV